MRYLWKRCRKWVHLTLVGLVLLLVYWKLRSVNITGRSVKISPGLIQNVSVSVEKRNGTGDKQAWPRALLAVNVTLFSVNVTQCEIYRHHIKKKDQLPATSQEYYCDMLAWCQKEDADRLQTTDQQLCPCFPPELQGQVALNVSQLLSHSWKDVLAAGEKLQLSPGGLWRPVECQPRRRVLVIIPYRDREHHLRAFLLHSLPIFHRQQIHFRIVVVEQGSPFTFNKASLMNIGFLEAVKTFEPDCVLFQDVDTLPERDDNLVICGNKPVKWAAYVDRKNYRLIRTHFGAAVLLRTEDFRKLNGFSNMYFGWGGEDENLLLRIRKMHMQTYFGASKVSRATIMSHGRDSGFSQNKNRDRLKQLAMRLYWKFNEDGLNSVQYVVREVKESILFTWIQVDIKAPQCPKMGSLRLQSRFTLMLKSVFIPTHAYTVILGECSRTADSRIADDSSGVLYKSRITCAHACDKVGDGCHGFQYVDSVDSDDFCVLLTAPCLAVLNTTGPMVYELHNKIT